MKHLSVQCKVQYTVLSTVYSAVQYALHTSGVYSAVYSALCGVHTVYSVKYSVQCRVQTTRIAETVNVVYSKTKLSKIWQRIAWPKNIHFHRKKQSKIQFCFSASHIILPANHIRLKIHANNFLLDTLKLAASHNKLAESQNMAVRYIRGEYILHLCATWGVCVFKIFKM